MILNNLKNIDDNFFSVIIIGSGPAGISAALKLEELKIKTLLIEAGNLEMSTTSKNFLKGNIIAEDYNDISASRSRMFGGTSNLWGGHCNKFEKNQFISWPVDYDELHSYEDQANKILESLEKEKDLSNSVENYQELLKLNKIIEKKFHKNFKNISEETKNKVKEIIKKK